MNIGIIGSGHMGSGLGRIWASQGHRVIFSHGQDKARLQRLAEAAGPNARSGTVSEAASQSQVLLLAVWPDSLEDVLRSTGPLSGKTVITCVSGLKPDFTGLTMGLPTELKISMAERIAQLAPGARVVEAFNVTFAQTLAANSRRFGPDRPSIFYCGDSDEAKVTVAGLIEACDYEGIDAGPLAVARSLETVASAWVQFAAVSGLFPNLGLKALRR
jgi:predicted dinucleotide-binding enzyme